MIIVDENKLNKLEKYGIRWTGYDYALLVKHDLTNTYTPVIQVVKEKNNITVMNVNSHSEKVLKIFKKMVEEKIIKEIADCEIPIIE